MICDLLHPNYIILSQSTKYRMSIDKDKVNALLLEFQRLLQSFKPNNSELQLITSKIKKMTERNIRKQQRSRFTNLSRKKFNDSDSSGKKRVKIPID